MLERFGVEIPVRNASREPVIRERVFVVAAVPEGADVDLAVAHSVRDQPIVADLLELDVAVKRSIARSLGTRGVQVAAPYVKSRSVDPKIFPRVGALIAQRVHAQMEDRLSIIHFDRDELDRIVAI